MRNVLRMSEKAIPSNTIVERLLSAKPLGTLYDRSWPVVLIRRGTADIDGRYKQS